MGRQKTHLPILTYSIALATMGIPNIKREVLGALATF